MRASLEMCLCCVTKALGQPPTAWELRWGSSITSFESGDRNCPHPQTWKKEAKVGQSLKIVGEIFLINYLV